MKRPSEYMTMTDGVTQHDYKQALNKYIDYLEAENKQLILSGVSQCFAIKEPIIIDAMKACFSVGYASTSLFTRRLNVPYKTAMKIIDTLEDNKMVGMFDGTAKRELILDEVEFKKLLLQNCG